jgi:hypothetical protein
MRGSCEGLMRRCPGRPAVLLAAVLTLATLTTLAAPVGAELSEKGNIIVFLDGGIAPHRLPRTHTAPVSVHLQAGIRTADRSPLPRVRGIRLEFAWRGALNTRGLPACAQARLRGVDTRQALRICGGALVGSGRLYNRVFVPGQKPFGLHAHLLAFNGRTRHGGTAIWVQAYSSNPPISFVLPFHVHHQSGPFRTALVSIVPRSVGPWPHFAHFTMVVGRRFFYRGHPYSYMSASCPVPRRFTAGFLSFARATFSLSNGPQLQAEAVRSCRAQ